MLSFLALLVLAAPVAAQTTGDVFTDAANGDKKHIASGFTCPSKIGIFERDAVGERDPKAGAGFCAYSALDGVYGTVTVAPLATGYEPRTALALDFEELEATGGRKLAEAPMTLGGASVYTRIYQTTSLEDIHYRVLFAAGAAGPWTVQVTMEYASPRDDRVEREFLDAVYAQAFRTLAR